jgi:NhaP-type Na+/H+ or K+/H+ antiporter
MQEKVIDDPELLILFMFTALSIGIVTSQLVSRINIAVPYPVIIFCLGLVCSAFSQFGMFGVWGTSVKLWANIDPDLFLYVFLPPLLFGEAMSLNWFHVIGAFSQAFLLACPGVVVGTLLTGVFAYFYIPSWSWNLAMVFGAVLSSTDVVAVVSLLKEVSASPKLTMIICGESLMNDGTSMVMFTLFFNMLKGQVYTIADIIEYFLKAFVGSSAFGCACGLLMVRWLRSAKRPLKHIDVYMQVAITLTGSYLVFFVAQNTFQISGLLACVSAGLMVAWLARPVILSHETMHNVWSMFEWTSNTMVFFLAGLIIGAKTTQTMSWFNLLNCIVLYIMILVIRSIIIAMFYPILSNIGHRCTAREAVFMSWAGLRGALGLALALIVARHDVHVDRQHKNEFLLFISGIVTLTLVVNATTAKWVLLRLGLAGSDTPEKLLIFAHIRRQVRKKLTRIVGDLHAKLPVDAVEEVWNSCSLFRGHSIPDPRESFVSTTSQSLALSNNPSVSISSSDLLSSMSDSFIDQNRIMSALGRVSNPVHKQESFASISRASYAPNQIITPIQSIAGERSTDIYPAVTMRSDSTGGSTRKKSLNDRENMALQYISERRQLSKSFRASSSNLDTSLGSVEAMIYIQTVFYEIIRAEYWHYIESGKLPRLSHTAQFLLYSVDVGLDRIDGYEPLKDYECIEREFDPQQYYIVRVLQALEQCTPVWCPIWTWCSSILGRLEVCNFSLMMITSSYSLSCHAVIS